MEKVISTERIPIKMWLDDIEEGALSQAKDLANLPFAYRHIAIMPDSHQGYGMPIGGVLATKKVIVPNAVGVDIGCGMSVIRTDIQDISTKNLKKVMGDIRKQIPVGFNKHAESQDEKWMPLLPPKSIPIVERQYNKARYQIGTLGGGNHFIEIQKGSDGYIWIMIHSGSRNIGYTVAKYYNQAAIELCEKWYSTVPKDLSFLALGTDEFKLYLAEMDYCIEFARQNRELMMERCKEAFSNVIAVNFSGFINKPHNFASWESHYGQNVIVHRKGATRARKGELGMIPGSQGTSSYIVRGLGNPESFDSCSHGAGRVMSRTKARNTLNLEQEKERLDALGVIHAIRSKNDLDEAPGSYKDIDKVMKLQADLVDIEIELKPMAVIKG